MTGTGAGPVRGVAEAGAAAGAPDGSARIVATTMVSMVVAVLPSVLVASMAVLLRAELGFSTSQLGMAVSTFMALSAVASIPGGRWARRVGHDRVLVIGAVGSVLSLVGVATLARDWLGLMAFMVLAGAANGFIQPATNQAIARAVPADRHGMALGLKMAAAPAATFLAGFAVPLIGLTVGWRWAFGAAAFVGAVVFATARGGRGIVVQPEPVGKGGHGAGATTLGLVAVAVGVGCAQAAGNTVGVFYVESAVAQGYGVGVAGAWLAVGSVFGIGGRVLFGWVGDRAPQDPLRVVAWLLVVAAAGNALLGVGGSAAVLTLATVLAFGAGRGWYTPLLHAIVRRHPEAPAAATGVIHMGGFTGGVVGPILFGLLAEHGTFRLAWLTTTGIFAVAILALQFGRRRLAPDHPVAPR